MAGRIQSITVEIGGDTTADCQHSCQYFLYFLCLPEGILAVIMRSFVNSTIMFLLVFSVIRWLLFMVKDSNS